MTCKKESKWEKALHQEIARYFREHTEYVVKIEGEKDKQPKLFYEDPDVKKGWKWLATVDIGLYEGDRLVKIIEFEEDVNPKNFYGVIMASVMASQTFPNTVEFNYVVPDDDKKVERGNWLLDLMRPALKNYPNVIVKPIMGETQFKAEIGFITEE